MNRVVRRDPTGEGRLTVVASSRDGSMMWVENVCRPQAAADGVGCAGDLPAL